MKNLAWLAVFPYMISYSSTTPHYAQLFENHELIFDCHNQGNVTQSCNDMCEIIKDAAFKGYLAGKFDAAVEMQEGMKKAMEGR